MHANVFDFSQLLAGLTDRYHEILRVSSLSVGIYVLDGGAMDHQKPHSEDEVYYVARGRAKMMIGSDGDTSTFDVGPGTIIFAPARVHHYVLRHHRATRGSRFLRPTGGLIACSQQPTLSSSTLVTRTGLRTSGAVSVASLSFVIPITGCYPYRCAIAFKNQELPELLHGLLRFGVAKGDGLSSARFKTFS